ncbi:MAG: hypothetical protein HRT88_14495 [Lentisphaeraceae bacterium]|nr:hypothetical protein [Lentisphaeraceae bacterium]
MKVLLLMTLSAYWISSVRVYEQFSLAAVGKMIEQFEANLDDFSITTEELPSIMKALCEEYQQT